MLQKKHIFGQSGLPECFLVLMLFLDLHFTRADAQEAPGAERDDTNWRGRFSHPLALNSRRRSIQHTYEQITITKNITNTHNYAYIYKSEGAL